MESQQPTRSRVNRWTAPNERIIVQVIHWFVVLVVVIAILVLALQHDLDRASITALYGGVLGHAGTAASQKLSSRHSDSD